MNKPNAVKRILPIRYARLHVGSEYQIFAEPSRDIRKSNDPTVYIKVAESYSVAKDEPSRAIILDPQDLVVPLSRGNV